ncbi:DUF3413 domain-containing protein [Vibrio sp. SS-MA-C1-2]|uniref:DUF3413 domain-containing protein n=1 Tax=Vibrio sp. SS-MA-C1-2 TaxID=2908646 RepID=UPI001F4280F4|nr:DUF3413 domain-containing protein [Vibrio sp. SS-MA-C1-2]UJF18225.1 DUF3413 domain-containing protein [Vibrio sp. SS-MA-C1-2]
MFKKNQGISTYFVVNSIIAMLISLRYFYFMPQIPNDFLGIVFVGVSIIGQMAIFTLLAFIVTSPILLLKNKIQKILIPVITTLLLSLLIIDTLVFAQYRFHINAIVLELVLSGDVVDFPLSTIFTVISSIVSILIIQYLLFSYCTKKNTKKSVLRLFISLSIVSLLLTHGLHIWAAANAFQPITTSKQYLPLFYPATSNKLMKKYGFINEKALQESQALKISKSNNLHYPLKPLDKEEPKNKLNIMLIVIDSWRYDTFNKDNTPTIYDLAKNSWVFNNQISTGNATRTGIFGLFYGLPGTYWHSFLANQESPLLIDRLQELDYNLGIFASAKLTKPEFNQTVFKNINHLRIRSEGKTPSERDINLTNDWINWYKSQPENQSKFSFLFYDAPHGYDAPKDYKQVYKPAAENIDYLALNNDYNVTPLFNRYKNSVHFVDNEIEKVIKTVKQSGDFENTVFIITGDHAQELNDNKLNYWGHNSNYTNAQIHIPLIIKSPTLKGKVNPWNKGYFTSHYDLAPTLMKNILGVKSSIHDYSTGIDLFTNPIDRKWLISAKYSGYAIINKTSILEVNGLGQSTLMDRTNHNNPDLKKNYKQINEALKMISAYNQ